MLNSSAIEGEFERVYGTSASAPVVASLITLINDARIAQRKKPVGFINPAVCFSPFYMWKLKLNGS